MKPRANPREDGLPQSTGIFVNTNETSGAYEAPWDHAEGRMAIRRIRRWQERLSMISQDHHFNEHGEAGE
ncbi:hypothetical protein [Rhizobium johnstonii]|uniref:hypothetical protein n=1 Tax=Rhizobium johnstonii TaxID=3019933 RepID=UPI003F95C05B